MSESASVIPEEHYLVSHGKSGGLASFSTCGLLSLRRGDRVVIDGPRGREVGIILCPAGPRPSRLIGVGGTIVRQLDADDESNLRQMQQLEDRLFEVGRQLAQDRQLTLEVVDAQVLFAGRAIVQVLADEQLPLDSFASSLSESLHLDVRLENLALPQQPDDEEHGCGKPDCGKAHGEGSCSSCATGGCSSCSRGAEPDLRPYFAHLRGQMEASSRTPLL